MSGEPAPDAEGLVGAGTEAGSSHGAPLTQRSGAGSGLFGTGAVLFSEEQGRAAAPARRQLPPRVFALCHHPRAAGVSDLSVPTAKLDLPTASRR